MKTEMLSRLILIICLLFGMALTISGSTLAQKASIATDVFGNPRISAPTNEEMFELSFAKIPPALKTLTIASPVGRLLNHGRGTVSVGFTSEIRAKESN